MTEEQFEGRQKRDKFPISYQADYVIPGLPHNNAISQFSAAFIGLGWDKNIPTKPELQVANTTLKIIWME